MRVLIAGEGGSVLVRGAEREAAALAAEGVAAPMTTPAGVVVYPADALPADLEIDEVELVACEPHTAAGVRAWARRRSVSVQVVQPTPMRAPRLVVAVSAASTGSGKTALTRRIVKALRATSSGVAVARHPIADLLGWERFGAAVARGPGDLVGPISEREELAPIVGLGVSVASGLDPEQILRLSTAEAGEGGVVVWDGGGAAEPWVVPDLHLLAVDLLRDPPTGLAARLEGADAVVLTKADSAPADRVRAMEASLAEVAPGLPVILADLAVTVGGGNRLRDARVVVVEDHASLVLGGLSAGAGAVAARRFRCGLVDPRPWAAGAVARVLEANPHIGPVIPALGRTPDEIDDLAASIARTPADAVLWASNADPAGVIGAESRPVIRAFGELVEVAGPSLQEILASAIG